MRDVRKLLEGPAILAAIAWTGAPAYLGGCSTTHPKKQLAKAEAGGIEQVSHVRRLLRAACGNLKEVNTGAPNEATLMAQTKDSTG